jgi:poly(beta-D-mannuronate) lyase
MSIVWGIFTYLLSYNPEYKKQYLNMISRTKQQRAFPIRQILKWIVSPLFIMLVVLLYSANSYAVSVTVSSLTELQKAVSHAVPGDIITLANGTYTSTADIEITQSGTAAKPITITAQTVGGVEINGTGGIRILSPASYIIIRGFKFTHSSGKAESGEGTSFCRWTRNIFETTGEGNYLTLFGSDQEVDYNTFQNKKALGKFIGVRGTGKQIAERLWIHHNYFNTFSKQQGNGAEAVQFGLSGFSLSSSNSIFENNLFENCEGENELLSVKSCAVTIRYNTIRNCPAQLTLRHGNFCKVYGNYFLNTPGLRIFGDDHLIFSNYFENCDPAINIGNGGAEVADGAPLTSHDRPDRVVIAFNTLVNNKNNITLNQRRPVELGATNITIANNIVQGGPEAIVINGPYVNPKWEGNILFDVKGPGNLSASGYKILDPKLVRTATGTYHLKADNPALHATGSYKFVAADMDGQTPKSSLLVGADQISSDPVVARILTPEMVGYAAGTVK